MNINTFIFTHKGNKSMKCKDVYKIVSYDNCHVIGLADGVSSQEYSDVGAITVLKDIGRMLAKEEALIELSAEEIKFKIVKTIRETMDKLAKKNKCTESKFASTIMILIIIENADYFWTVHLGDGLIGMIDNEGELNVLSAAQNGIMKNFTYTTASYDLLKRVRVKKNDMGGDIFLMTDGIVNEICKNEESRKKYVELIKKRDWKDLKKRLLSDEPKDDIGFCGVTFLEELKEKVR